MPADPNQQGEVLSASRLAEVLGEQVPAPDQLPASANELADAVRDLVAAVVVSDIGDDERAEIAARVDELTARLRTRVRDPYIRLTRHPGGWVDNLTQAGSGWWNPQAPRLRFEPLRLPEPASVPSPVEVRATCVLTEAHGGPPGRAHGGVVVTLLDEVLGVSCTAAGATGMTAGMNVRFRGATPLGELLELRARYVRSDGRKRFSTGELLAGGVLCAEAEGIFIAPDRP